MKVRSIRIAMIGLCLIALSTNSCDESRIEIEPLTPTEQDFFDEEIDFQRTLFGIYAKMTDFFDWNGGVSPSDGEDINSPSFSIWQLPGDDMTMQGSFGAALQFENFKSLQSSNVVLRNYYSNSYQVISRANVLLEKIENVEDGVYQTPNLKEWNKGEALFLRAYMHFGLWNFYGTAPLLTKRITSQTETFAEPTTGTQLLDQVIIDLTEAASLLPTKEQWGAANAGRVNKNSAFGLLGKALVFRGTVNNSTADFTAAIAAFNSISGASLMVKFDDNFAFDTENNDESLFEFQAGSAASENIWLPNDFQIGEKAMSVSSWVPFNNINNWAYGGAPFVATTKLLNAFEAGDPRLELTMDPATRAIRKYVSRDQTLLGGASSVNNPRILRYADVLLLKAEAIIRSNGSTAEAVALINQVRARARGAGSVPADKDVNETNRTTILQWIMNERFIELAFEEGTRWFDLRRWHLAGDIDLDDNTFSSDNTGFDFDASRNLVFPIPQEELNQNIKMKQNPGY